MLPVNSEISLSKGIWFIYNDDINSIKYWVSAINGKEKIFLNDKLIKESRNIKMKSEHIINDEKGNQYKVSLQSINLRKGHFECEFSMNNILEKKFVTQFVRKNDKYRTLLLLLTCGLGFYLMVFHNIPIVLFIGIFAASFALGFFLFPLGNYVVEEIDVQHT